MKNVIENIRNKPEHHRDRIVWICAAIFTGLLLIVWMIVGSGRKTTTDESFFQTFNQGVEEGKTVVPQDINANLNTNSVTTPDTSTQQ
jgi:hypothetical protein